MLRNYQLALSSFLLPVCFLTLLIENRLKSFWNDPGMGWHAVVGDDIFGSLILPQTDYFTFLSAGENWLLDQWLADYLFAAVRATFGWTGLTAVLIILFVWAFAGRQFCKISELYGQNIITVFTVLLTFFFAQVHFIGRPVIISFLLFSVIFFCLLNSSERQEGQLTRRDYCQLGIVTLLWVNIHPSYLVILPLLVVYSAVAALKYSRPYYQLIALWIFLVACSCINPYLFELHYTMFGLSWQQLIAPSYNEWQRIESSNTALISILSITALLLIPKYRLIRSHLFLSGTFLLFTAMALLAYRFLPYYGIVAGCFLAFIIPQYSALLRYLPGVLAQPLLRINNRESNLVTFKLVFLGLAVGLLLCSPWIEPLADIRSQVASGDYYSAAASQKITEDWATGSERARLPRVINDSNLGGSLIFYQKKNQTGLPAYFPAIDDRTSLHGRAAYSYLDHYLTPEKLPALQKATAADYLLLSNGARYSKLVQYLKKTAKDQILLLNGEVVLIKLEISDD